MGEKGNWSVCTVWYGLNISETDIYWLREMFYRRNVRGFRALDILPIGMPPRYIHKALNVHISSFRGSGTVHTSHR